MLTQAATRKRERVGFGRRMGAATLAAAFGAAFGLFFVTLGLTGLFSYWGDGVLVVFICAALAALAAWLAPFGGQLTVVAGLFAIELLYVAVALTPLSKALLKHLPRNDGAPARAEAVYVFGSSVRINGELDEAAMARLLHGLELLGTGKASRLVVPELAAPARSFSEAATAVMRRLGLKYELIAIGPVRNSRDEALAVAELFGKRGWKRVLAVTSPAHSRRACATLERVGLSVSCSPAAETRYDFETLTHADDRLRAFGAALHEWLGMWVYRKRGWIR
ncbi:MAG: YdcF family protein [Deltaproteobacteria bacterium]|nr:YdcF family protein [Deltaproteobacteria bacterium]